MKSLFKSGQPNQPTLVLLHGTGGDEKDLLPIANYLNPNATVLSLRGDVSENASAIIASTCSRSMPARLV